MGQISVKVVNPNANDPFKEELIASGFRLFYFLYGSFTMNVWDHLWANAVRHPPT